MKRILDSTEILGEVERTEGICDVCAGASAVYDETSGQLLVNLDAWCRTTDIRERERRIADPVLPAPESIHESVSEEDAADLAREIFHRWVRKVRAAVGSIHAPTI